MRFIVLSRPYYEDSLKCVASEDMSLPTNFRDKYESIQMPIMESCNPSQFIEANRVMQEWSLHDVACYKPDSPIERLTSPPEFRVKFEYGIFSIGEFIDRIPKFRMDEVIYMDGYIGGGSNSLLQVDDSYNNEIHLIRSQKIGNTKIAHGFKTRRDKRGCDVYELQVSEYERTGWKFEKSKLLFTVGIDKGDGSMVLKSDSVNFCFERIKDKSILQTARFHPIKRK